jgi:hypothetical protein
LLSILGDKEEWPSKISAGPPTHVRCRIAGDNGESRFVQILHVSREETEDRLIYELGNVNGMFRAYARFLTT